MEDWSQAELHRRMWKPEFGGIFLDTKNYTQNVAGAGGGQIGLGTTVAHAWDPNT